MPSRLSLPTSPAAARIFFGFRAPHLERGDFFRDLGETFMPGTPLMQAPLGLVAYLPAVIDPPEGSGLPDEMAIIVYVSRAVYDDKRDNSLSRRMYSASHTAVFDMPAGGAGFPAGIDKPATLANARVGELALWHLFDEPNDWQAGDARFLFLRSESVGANFKTAVTGHVRDRAQALRHAGCEQVIAACADGFAGLWLHSSGDARAIPAALVAPDGAEVLRDLRFEPHWVHGDAEPGVPINGAGAHNWRFARDLSYFA